MTSYYKAFLKRHKLEYDEDVDKAFEIAELAHEGQQRKSGESYFVHPLAVTDILAELGLDNATLIAGILHDVVEDTSITLEEIRKQFTPEIAKLVDGVTKLKNYEFEFESREEQQSESLRHMFLAMANDIRVVIIKLADRLHNMRTLKYQSENKQIEKAKETLEIYAPLAHRLGISAIKWELEDLSLKFLHPDEYYEIANQIAATRDERESQLATAIAKLYDKLSEMKITAEIAGRPKHIYSIYKKMRNQNKTFSEIYDLIAIRVIVSSIKDCYGALGLVHTLWRPLPNRFKDYVAVPKQNMYQSLHTTLLGDDGKPFEVQIRTVEMHKTAEYGIAAHWKYKEGVLGSEEMNSKLAWLRELMEWQNDLKDSREFMDSLKIDVFSDHVLVFTPNGDVKDFVTGATPLDFAYSIHSDIGNQCMGARINGKIVPLNYELKTGDIVEIMTSKSSPGPGGDWLNIAKTAQARSKINQWFKRERKEENIAKGKELFDREARRRGVRAHDLLEPEWLSMLYKRFSLKSLDDMYAAAGLGMPRVGLIVSKLLEQYKIANDISEEEIKLAPKHPKRLETEASVNNISVKGCEGLAVDFAKCCNPVPGDDIIGYVTRGRGVRVHLKSCRNVKDIEDPERLTEVEWIDGHEFSYNVEFRITADDRKGLFMDISQAVCDCGKNISTVSANTAKNGVATIYLGADISSVDDMTNLMRKLKNVKGVIDVTRVNY